MSILSLKGQEFQVSAIISRYYNNVQIIIDNLINFRLDKVGDELLLAPLGLFNTEVFALTGQDKRGQGQANATGDPEDPHDADYLRETSVSSNNLHISHFSK